MTEERPLRNTKGATAVRWFDTYAELTDPFGVTWAMNQPKR